MRFFRANTFLVFSALFFSIISASACGDSETNSNLSANTNKPNNVNKNSETTKDDVAEFGKIVKLPFQPEEVSWRELEDKKIIAVMKFSAADAQNLITQIEKQKPVQNAAISSESWFPPELIAKSQQSGDDTIKGKEYAANDFLLAPYTKGKITRIDDTNYFVLELTVS